MLTVRIKHENILRELVTEGVVDRLLLEALAPLAAASNEDAEGVAASVDIPVAATDDESERATGLLAGPVPRHSFGGRPGLQRTAPASVDPAE